MPYIGLSRGQQALVDEEDYESLSQYKWTYHSKGYAYRTTGPKKKRITILMHRQVMNAPEGIEVDHQNRNKLDNRRSNLRLATDQQNSCNRPVQKNSISGIKGVHKNHKGWQARIQHNGETHRLGTYPTIEEAAEVYRAKAVELQGPFTPL